MSTFTITLSKDYGYVLVALASAFGVATWQSARCGAFRKAAGQPYPRPYALNENSWSNPQEPGKAVNQQQQNEYLFNCSQRSHAQLVEHLPIAIPGMLVAGLRFPLTTAGLGVFWSFNRVLYAMAYTRKDKDGGRGRIVGSGYAISELAFMGMIAYMGYEMITA